MENNTFEIITGRTDVRTYQEPDCYELSGEEFQVNLLGLGLCEMKVKRHTLSFCGREYDYHCVKCEDAAYLLAFNGKFLFYDAETGKAVLADGEKLYVSEEDAGENGLKNWEVNLTFAAFHTALCRFDEKELTIGENKWPARYVKLTDDLYFVKADTADGCLVMVLDIARFLMVGGLKDNLRMGGYLEIPKEPPKPAE